MRIISLIKISVFFLWGSDFEFSCYAFSGEICFSSSAAIKCSRLGKPEQINGERGSDNKNSNIFSVNLHSVC